MKTLMSNTERYLTTTELEAQSLVSQMRQEHGNYVKSHSITRRMKKDVEFFVVNITIEFYKINDLVVTD
jgi:hypothetical protein